MTARLRDGITVLDYIKCPINYRQESMSGLDYLIKPRYFDAESGGLRDMKGWLYIDDSNFIGGHLKVRGKDEGRYPFHFLEMIDYVFGKEPNTIEVCARTVRPDSERTAFTVDLNPAFNPSKVTDATTLAGIENSRFNRYRADPPYNMQTADKMYGTSLPSFIDMLKAGARVCNVGSLMFLLLGPTNYQHCPPGVVRVGLVYISVIPNNETRALNIYLKVSDEKADGYQGTL